MFRLLRYFSITSAIAILLVTACLSYLYWKSENTKLTKIIESQNVALAQSFANNIWPKYSTHVNSVSHLDGDALRAHPKTIKIHQTLKALTKGLPILKVKMYSLDALTVYSSEFSQIGASKKGNAGFESTVKNINPTTKNSFRETFASFDGPVSNRYLVESYLPIIGTQGELEGVFELYSDVTPLVAEINWTTIEVILYLLFFLGLLYVFLFWIVRNADTIIGKQHDDLVLAQKEAITANTAKSNFLSTMSHEIRTPLNGVLGLAQLLISTDLNKEQKHQVSTILSSGETLLAIINDVLDMSRIEASSVQLEEKTFNIKELISMIATPFQSLIDDKGLKLNVNFEAGSDLLIKGDPVRLRQVLWNLVSNAIKFTDSGSITLNIEQIAPDHTNITEIKDLGLHFSVTDTGAGIAPDRVDSIFEAFTQEDATITRKHGGTGLGLTIVKQLTQLMGGSITVKSQLEHGTSFDVFVPFYKGSKSDIEQVLSPKVRSNAPMNVLVAEDNDLNAVIAVAFLKKNNCEVRRVENGLEAVEAAKEGWADIILMDVHMPEMNGLDATIQIRSTPNGKDIPIVGLTAEAFVERHAQFVEAGMNGVLTKPFTQQQLEDTLSQYRGPKPQEKAVS
ncbi:ATP-binding protein [Kiloniella antarctica]|uniref:histidine kinase n=1 Tax=Kiloniella antarctica TaxID=1550907 RepID=A0ABW5BJT0_9PROT